METYLIERPVGLPAGFASLSVVDAILAADAACLLSAHSVLAQARPVPAPAASGSNGINGTTGFMGEGIRGFKRTDVRGVPPRGRPV
ncbi:MAG TPA: hypothetical protein VFX61_18715 [Micromonosporaceae bacterium]|nr:hypothetical protein [Micromonosporaceae bacterium]